MTTPTSQQGAPSTDEAEVRALYRRMLDGWNARSRILRLSFMAGRSWSRR